MLEFIPFDPQYTFYAMIRGATVILYLNEQTDSYTNNPISSNISMKLIKLMPRNMCKSPLSSPSKDFQLIRGSSTVSL